MLTTSSHVADIVHSSADIVPGNKPRNVRSVNDGKVCTEPKPRSVEIPFGHIALLLGWATFPTSRGVIFCVNVVPAPRYNLAEPP